MGEQRGEHRLAQEPDTPDRIAAADPGQAEVAALGGDGVVGRHAAVVEQVVGADILAHIGDAAILLDRLGADLAGTGGQVELAGQVDAGGLQRLGGHQETGHRPAVVGDRIAVEHAVLEPAFLPFAIEQGLGTELVGVEVGVPGGRLGVQVGGEQQVAPRAGIAAAAIGSDDVRPLRERADLAGRKALPGHPVVHEVAGRLLVPGGAGDIAEGKRQFDDLGLVDRRRQGRAIGLADRVWRHRAEMRKSVSHVLCRLRPSRHDLGRVDQDRAVEFEALQARPHAGPARRPRRRRAATNT